VTPKRDFIYLDQAATSWPKPDAVARAMAEALDIPGSPSRSAHAGARQAERVLAGARRSAARFFSTKEPDNLIFVASATAGLNMVLRGTRKESNVQNEHLIIAYSGSEHNAVTRTLLEVAGDESNLILLPIDTEGYLELTQAEKLISSKRPDIVVCQHGSNVTGAIQPVEELAAMCKAYDAALIVDGSQVAGYLPVKLDALAGSGVSAWVCSGHKGLRGPSGSALVYLAQGFYPRPHTTGGTGSGEHFVDYSEPQRPIDYEAGTPGLPAIAGLGAAFGQLQHDFAKDLARISDLTAHLMQGLNGIEGLTVLGPAFGTKRLPLASFVIEGRSSDEIAFILDKRYGIASRAGMHCAPLAHRQLGTHPEGAVRLSWNATNTLDQIDRTMGVLRQLT